ncbi:MAG: hypothetical protein ACT4NY_01940 [Pseudonocardiales bacterium]
MNLDGISSYIKNYLGDRGLFLRSDQGTRVLVCLPDGSSQGITVGWVDQESGIQPGWWRARWIVPGRGLALPPLDAGGRDLNEALKSVLEDARYGDILAARERESGVATTYTAMVTVEGAEQLAGYSDPDLQGTIHLGGGKVQFTNVAVAYLRGETTMSWWVDSKNQLWAGFDGPYPLTHNS